MKSDDWSDVGAEADFEVGVSREVDIDGIEIAMHPTEEGFFATAAVCTHEVARLCEGFLDGTEIECPKHLALFDVRSGEALNPPASEPLATFECAVADGRVFVKVRAAQ